MNIIKKSHKLDNVCYDIRGPVLKEAKRLEEEGNKVLKLNIGNPAPLVLMHRTKFWSMLFVTYPALKAIVTPRAYIPPVKLSFNFTKLAICAI